MRDKRTLHPKTRSILSEYGFTRNCPYKYWQFADNDIFIMPTQKNASGRFCGFLISSDTWSRTPTYVVEARTRHDVWINIRREILERDDDDFFSPDSLPEDRYLRKASSKPRKKSTDSQENEIEGTIGFIEL